MMEGWGLKAMRRQEEKGGKESMDEREKRKIKKKKGKAGEKR